MHTVNHNKFYLSRQHMLHVSVVLTSSDIKYIIFKNKSKIYFYIYIYIYKF
jgi:hypothetical protein